MTSRRYAENVRILVALRDEKWKKREKKGERKWKKWGTTNAREGNECRLINESTRLLFREKRLRFPAKTRSERLDVRAWRIHPANFCTNRSWRMLVMQISLISYHAVTRVVTHHRVMPVITSDNRFDGNERE